MLIRLLIKSLYCEKKILFASFLCISHVAIYIRQDLVRYCKFTSFYYKTINSIKIFGHQFLSSFSILLYFNEVFLLIFLKQLLLLQKLGSNYI